MYIHTIGYLVLCSFMLLYFSTFWSTVAFDLTTRFLFVGAAVKIRICKASCGVRFLFIDSQGFDIGRVEIISFTILCKKHELTLIELFYCIDILDEGL